MLLTIISLLGYLMTATHAPASRLTRRRDQVVTALATLALLLGLGLIREVPPAPALVVASAGAVGAWLWARAVWRSRSL